MVEPGHTSAAVPTTVAGAFMDSASRYADRVAMVTVDGHSVTYRELAGQVRVAVAVLQALGCKTGDRIAVWLPNEPGWPVVQYAAALLGLLIIPVNARYRAKEAEYVLQRSGARVLFTQRSFLTNDYLARLREMAGGPIGTGDSASIPSLPNLKTIVMLDAQRGEGIAAFEEIARGVDPEAVDLEALARQRKPSDPMWIYWTSGSTSAPKGAVLDQSSIGNIWNWTQLCRFTGEDRILATLPLFYVSGAFWGMLAAMLRGGVLVLGRDFTTEEIVRLCRRERVTVLGGIAVLLKNLVVDPEFDPAAFESVRLGWFGGATISEEDLVRVRERLGYEHFIQIYGMTELQGFATSTHPDDPPEVAYRTAGKPLPGFDLRLIDPATGEPVEPGQTGALVVGPGRRLVDYEGMGASDRARFFDAQDLYHTGDLMRIDENGNYAFVGRIKDLIKVGGENVSAAEIETVLMTYPGVRNVAVIGTVDADRGEVPAAFIEPLDGEIIDVAAVQEWCRSRIAPFKVPRHWKVLAGDEWPKMPSGKVARWMLKVD